MTTTRHAGREEAAGRGRAPPAPLDPAVRTRVHKRGPSAPPDTTIPTVGPGKDIPAQPDAGDNRHQVSRGCGHDLILHMCFSLATLLACGPESAHFGLATTACRGEEELERGHDSAQRAGARLPIRAGARLTQYVRRDSVLE